MLQLLYLILLGAPSPCYTFSTVDRVGDATEIEVREKHDASCGGDPGIAPIADRLRVHASGTVERYDVLTDTWK